MFLKQWTTQRSLKNVANGGKQAMRARRRGESISERKECWLPRWRVDESSNKPKPKMFFFFLYLCCVIAEIKKKCFCASFFWW